MGGERQRERQQRIANLVAIAQDLERLCAELVAVIEVVHDSRKAVFALLLTLPLELLGLLDDLIF